MFDYQKLYANHTPSGRPVFLCLECEKETDDRTHRCPSCKGAIDVLYPLDRVSFGAMDSNPNPLRRYKDVLPIADEDHITWLGEGNTPCTNVPALARLLGVRSLYVKDETRNPTRSTKDRIASASLSRFKGLGVSEFVMASTGNSSMAYANSMSLVRGFKLHIFVGEQFAYRLNYADHPHIATHAVSQAPSSARATSRRSSPRTTATSGRAASSTTPAATASRCPTSRPTSRCRPPRRTSSRPSAAAWACSAATRARSR